MTHFQIPNPMATLYYAEHVHIVWTQTWVPMYSWIPNCYCPIFGKNIRIQIGIRPRLRQCKLGERLNYITIIKELGMGAAA